MSFQDLLRDMEAGVLRPAAPPSQEVAQGVFQLNTKVAALRYMADALSTPRDNPSLRGRLRGTRASITRLARNTSQALRQAATAAADDADESSASTFSKLTMDFESAMNEYHKVEKCIAAVERKETAARRTPKSSSSSSSHRSNNGDNNNQTCSDSDQKQMQMVMIPPTQQEIMRLENEIEYNEAIIAEREQGILEVQKEIADIHEIFKDLAVLVHDQGECIEIVTSNIEKTAAATSQAEVQLSKAAGIREEEKEKLLNGAEEKSSNNCLMLAVLGLLLFIVGLVFIS
uniref:t-SNARE coiled-coil homology domain-containing protein n=1 Tax=Leersia perrieri TaxID=77586 RepID=A0A0D9WNF4_9ORYZ